MRRIGCLLTGCLGVLGLYFLESAVYFWLLDRAELDTPAQWALFLFFFLLCAVWLRLVRIIFSPRTRTIQNLD